MTEWIEQELACADLGDKRLLRRMKQILERLYQSPMTSIKAAFKGWAEIIAAYRFFNHESTTVESILHPHREATLLRVCEHQRVLVIQDTTELDYTTKKKLEGKGPLSIKERQGFFAHNHLVVTPERVVLGVWNTEIYARNEEEHGTSNQRKQKPIEAKESFRWLEGYRDACVLAKRAGRTQIISCSDREGDIYEVFEEWQDLVQRGEVAADWLIRCNQNRRLYEQKEKFPEQQTQEKHIQEHVENSPLLGTISFSVKQAVQNKKTKGNSTQSIRTARQVTQEIRATSITLRPPWRKAKKLPKVTFNVVMAKEMNPPQGEDPICWLLLTSLKVTEFESARQLVELYLARWEIEVFHRVLKTGCRVEELQLKNDDRTKVAIALYMIVSWRVLYVMKLGRECPDLPCDFIFEEDEWKSLWVITYGEAALEHKPTLEKFMIELARHGGFAARKGDGVPGPQAIWQGMMCLRNFTLSWRVFVKKEKPLRSL